MTLPLLKVLEYANDSFVFLHRFLDMDRLHTHPNTYQKASNVTLNTRKTILISLSDKQQTAWNTKLIKFGFPDCHDYQHSEAVVY
ncbi:hypothetical protein BDC45DRAFT_512737 [Circinella umbellata]|nr:hypothetical protein BDC45DRAFT_512737 [Circinella umbellata]